MDSWFLKACHESKPMYPMYFHMDRWHSPCMHFYSRGNATTNPPFDLHNIRYWSIHLHRPSRNLTAKHYPFESSNPQSKVDDTLSSLDGLQPRGMTIPTDLDSHHPQVRSGHNRIQHPHGNHAPKKHSGGKQRACSAKDNWFALHYRFGLRWGRRELQWSPRYPMGCPGLGLSNQQTAMSKLKSTLHRHQINRTKIAQIQSATPNLWERL